MNAMEIKSLLSRYTAFEKMFLENSSLKEIDSCPVLQQDTLDEKKMPFSRIDINRLFAPGRHMFDENCYIPDGEKIAFRIHPRFVDIPEHRHSFIEMFYVYSGSCVQSVNGIRIPMKEGDFCILDTNVFHSFEKAGNNDIIVDCLMRKSYFDSTFMGQLGNNELMSCFFVRAICQDRNYNQYILFHAQDNPTISQMMINVLCEYFDKGICADSLINAYMIIIFTELLRVYQSGVGSLTAARLSSAAEANIGGIVDYIRRNHRTVTLESVAKKFNFHPSTLCTVLKRYGGAKFTDIVHSSRLEHACLLLKNTEMSIESIVNEVGYSNTTFFYRIFRQYYGVTPSEYRKKC